MLLRNYDIIQTILALPFLKTRALYTYINKDGDSTEEKFCFKDTAGSLRQVAKYNDSPVRTFFTDMANNTIGYTYGNNLICGSGNTPATYDDYCLENIFTTSQVQNVGHEAGPVIYDTENETFSVIYSKTYRALTDITVSEIGVTSAINANTGGLAAACLVYRKVLDTPIEVPANANFVLSFTITVSANPNKPADYNASAILVE